MMAPITPPAISPSTLADPYSVGCQLLPQSFDPTPIFFPVDRLEFKLAPSKTIELLVYDLHFSNVEFEQLASHGHLKMTTSKSFIDDRISLQLHKPLFQLGSSAAERAGAGLSAGTKLASVARSILSLWVSYHVLRPIIDCLL